MEPVPTKFEDMKPAATQVKVAAIPTEDSTAEAPATVPNLVEDPDGDPASETPATPPKTHDEDEVSAEGPDPGGALAEALAKFLPEKVPGVPAEDEAPAAAVTKARYMLRLRKR